MSAELPVLVTARLVLRLPEPQDFEAYACFASDPETMAHLGGALPRALAWRDFTLRAGAWMTRGFAMFSVIERASGRWVGRVGPWAPEGWPAPEIGWSVAREVVGKGYAHEAAIASIDYAVDTLGWEQIHHMIAPANSRSIALAERLGAVNRGAVQLPPPLETYRCDAWGQSAAQWRTRRADSTKEKRA